MFKSIDYADSIPPNFIQSILTNASLYKMFKDDFESNREYFQNIDREVYLGRMLSFIEDTLFSSNIFHIYANVDDLDEFAAGKLFFIKNFYDDFLLEAFNIDPTGILKTKLFKGLEYARLHDSFASKTKEFNDLYDYIFKESLDYLELVKVLLKDPLAALKKGEALSLKDFDILCYYVKNNKDGSVDMDIVTAMLHNHAYKMNHIFDIDVAHVLVASVLYSYLDSYGIAAQIKFTTEEDESNSKENREAHIICIENSLVEGFCSLNYVELFSKLFYEADLLRDYHQIISDEVSRNSLNTLMSIVSLGIYPEEILDPLHLPEKYVLDVEASSFIKALRFFESFKVNLFNSYIGATRTKISLEKDSKISYSKKEISLDQRFELILKKYPRKEELIKNYRALNLIYKPNGVRINTLELIKNIAKSDSGDYLIDYMHSRILDPESMIEDVNRLSSYRTKDPKIISFIEQELKYIYVDTFFYSIDSYLKLNLKIDREAYLSDILTKINCIASTPLTHRFIDEAIFTIESIQN